MNELQNLNMVDWSRAQFALTAMYHWIFVPLTLGLSWLLAFFETLYVKTGNPEWRRITRFWMMLFGINFAIGVATGIILEFEFGTNWSNYAWMVGDIFGAPLAAEGIFAFFLEASFFAVMLFGWNGFLKKPTCLQPGWWLWAQTFQPCGFLWQMPGCNTRWAWRSTLTKPALKCRISGKSCFLRWPSASSLTRPVPVSSWLRCSWWGCPATFS